jgi:hypothetical protein
MSQLSWNIFFTVVLVSGMHQLTAVAATAFGRLYD